MRRTKRRVLDAPLEVRDVARRIVEEVPAPLRASAVAGTLYVVALRGLNAAGKRRAHLEHEVLQLAKLLSEAREEESTWLGHVERLAGEYAAALHEAREARQRAEWAREEHEERVRRARECDREWTIGIGPDVDPDDLW